MKTRLQPLLIALALLAPAFLPALSATDAAKWHPGHYIFVGEEPLKPEILAIPHFRGVQKIFAWRSLEPSEGHYDFSALRADLALAKEHGRQIVVQLTFKSFTPGARNCPDYITGPGYGGGVYVANEGLNPVIWNPRVNERFTALITALGREFDSHPHLEAVNLPETAPSLSRTVPQAPEIAPYSEQVYFAALKAQMSALRRAFPRTVVIQYTNFPPSLLGQFTDYELEIGVGMGGPDLYPREDAINHPQTGIYRLYPKMAGKVPLGTAVQSSNYRVADKKRNGLKRGLKVMNGRPIVITPEDEILISPREHLALAREKLGLNYIFWGLKPADGFALVKQMLGEPDLADDHAGGLHAALPPGAFAKP